MQMPAIPRVIFTISSAVKFPIKVYSLFINKFILFRSRQFYKLWIVLDCMRKIGDKNAQQASNKSIQRSHVEKRAQQEMIGFVLIVVVVVIALMIFLVISMRKPAQTSESREVENILLSLSRTTTACSISDNFKNVDDLVLSCYRNQECESPEMSACDFMNKSLGGLLEDIFKSENGYKGYEFSVNILDNSTAKEEILYEKKEGVCLGAKESGSTKISTSDRKVNINSKMTLCS
jgi:hypothetical protein